MKKLKQHVRKVSYTPHGERVRNGSNPENGSGRGGRGSLTPTGKNCYDGGNVSDSPEKTQSSFPLTVFLFFLYTVEAIRVNTIKLKRPREKTVAHIDAR